MSSTYLESNKKLVKNWILQKLQGQGNPFEDLDQEVVFYIPGANENPIFGEFVGIQKVKMFFQILQDKLLQKQIKQTFEVNDCIAEDNRVVVLLEEIFTLSDSDNSSLESHRNSTVWLFELNNQQKIIYLHCYDNTLVTSEILA